MKIVLLGMLEVFQRSVSLNEIGVKQLDYLKLQALLFYLLESYRNLFDGVQRRQPELGKYLVEGLGLAANHFI